MSIQVNFSFKRNTRSKTSKKLIRTSDGDTPIIEQPIRMVSCDTPEKSNYAGRPEISQPKLNKCKERLENGFYENIPHSLCNYLIEKLTDDAATKHINAGNDATIIFEDLLEERLTKSSGSKRRTAVIPTGEVIDTYGRLLAYIAPWFNNDQNDPLPPKGDPRRKTFNLNMIENGWAAFFPIYPSLPNNDDMNMAIAAAEGAWNSRSGIWKKYGDKVLLAYEYRICIKLGTALRSDQGIKDAFKRICIDLRNLNIVGKYDFHKVPPCYRLWIWEKDIEQAKIDLELQ
ncbi:MAG: thermonuclease family protein [Nitrososphaeraceae archaeon]